MELAPYVLEERGASLGQLLSFFVPGGYRLYNERTSELLPSTSAELSGMRADGAGVNVIARVDWIAKSTGSHAKRSEACPLLREASI